MLAAVLLIVSNAQDIRDERRRVDNDRHDHEDRHHRAGRDRHRRYAERDRFFHFLQPGIDHDHPNSAILQQPRKKIWGLSTRLTLPQINHARHGGGCVRSVRGNLSPFQIYFRRFPVPAIGVWMMRESEQLMRRSPLPSIGLWLCWPDGLATQIYRLSVYYNSGKIAWLPYSLVMAKVRFWTRPSPWQIRKYLSQYIVNRRTPFQLSTIVSVVPVPFAWIFGQPLLVWGMFAFVRPALRKYSSV